MWLIDLEPAVGAEMRKVRPAVIVSDDKVGILPLKVIVPITAWQERYARAPWMVRLEPVPGTGIEKRSAADAFQVRSLAQARFVRRLGELSDGAMAQIAEALDLVLAINQ